MGGRVGHLLFLLAFGNGSTVLWVSVILCWFEFDGSISFDGWDFSSYKTRRSFLGWWLASYLSIIIYNFLQSFPSFTFDGHRIFNILTLFRDWACNPRNLLDWALFSTFFCNLVFILVFFFGNILLFIFWFHNWFILLWLFSFHLFLRHRSIFFWWDLRAHDIIFRFGKGLLSKAQLHLSASSTTN